MRPQQLHCLTKGQLFLTCMMFNSSKPSFWFWTVIFQLASHWALMQVVVATAGISWVMVFLFVWCETWFTIWHWCHHYIASISQCPTNQIVEKIDIRNIIWLVKKILFPMSLMTSATIVALGSYCESGLTQESFRLTHKLFWDFILVDTCLYMHVELFFLFNWTGPPQTCQGTG